MAHGLAAGRWDIRVSRDIDVLANVITSPAHLPACVRNVRELGFEPHGGNYAVLHRFARPSDGISIDIVAPDHPPPRRRLTSVTPRRTVVIEGGHQALTRTILFDARMAGRRVLLPVPSLLGALVLKAAAHRVDPRDRERHVNDAAFLAGLVVDPRSTKAAFKGSDKKRLRHLDLTIGRRDHAAWRALGDSADDAYNAWKLLVS
jgi:hypothetical protein